MPLHLLMLGELSRSSHSEKCRDNVMQLYTQMFCPFDIRLSHLREEVTSISSCSSPKVLVSGGLGLFTGVDHCI
jgi:hypothetical protein